MHETRPAKYNEDEITLSEIWGVVVSNKLPVLAFPLVAMLIALIVTSLLKTQWEASAMIRVGQVGQINQMVGPTAQLIEPGARVVDRIKQEGFKNDVLKQLGVSADPDDAERLLYIKKLNVELGGGADLIKITTRGHTPEQARQFAEATLSELAKQHKNISATTLKRLENNAIQLKKEIALAEKQQETSKKLLARTLASHVDFMENIELSNLVQHNDEELRNLKHSLAIVEEQLDPIRTYPTDFLQGVYVDDQPAFPKTNLIIPLSGIIGLFAGLFSAFLLNVLHTSKKRPASVNSAE